MDQELFSKSLFAFHAIDTDNSGSIDAEEFGTAIQNLRESVPDFVEFTDLDIAVTFKKLDLDKTGQVSYF